MSARFQGRSVAVAWLFCLAAGIFGRIALGDDAGSNPPWKAALEKASVRTWDKIGDNIPVSTLLSEAVFWSVTKSGESPRPSDVIEVPDLTPYLQAMDEEPDGVKALAALNAAENLCAEKGRPDLAGLIETTAALRWRGTKASQAAAQRLAERIKAGLPAADDKEKLPAAVKALLETGSEESARAVAEFAGKTSDSEVAVELNTLLFASLPPSSDIRRAGETFLANRAVGGSGLASWLETRGEKKLAARMRLDLVEFVEDATTVARLWQKLADDLLADKDARRAAPFYLAAAEIVGDPETQKALREKALSVLAQAGQEQAALDMCARLIGPDVSAPALKEFLGKARIRAQQELPVLKDRILRSPSTEVGCQALSRALRYSTVMPGAVDDLCREVLTDAPESRAAALVLLAKSEQLCRQGSFADASALLERLPEARTPADLRAERFERAGDCCLAQGKCREASEAYRSAAKEYYYEYELGGFGFFGLKKRALPPEASAEDQRIDAECLKGYLELAGGRTCEGISRMERLVLALRKPPAESSLRKLRLSDARFLLATAWLEEGANEIGAAEGYAAIQAASREPQERASLFAFAQMLAARTSPDQAQAAAPARVTGSAGGNPFAAAAAAVQKGNYVEARADYKRILDSLKERDTKTVLDTCSGMLQCLVKEHQADGFDTAQARFREWVARSLPEGYEGCVTVALARVCYQRSDLQGAAERIQTCLATDDAYLVTQAHMLDGLIKFRSGQTAEALPCFEEALARTAPDDPAGAEAMFLVGYINMVNGDSDKARKSFEALVKRYPGSNYALKCRELLDRLKATEAKAAMASNATKDP